jgi:hypothetical protein
MPCLWNGEVVMIFPSGVIVANRRQRRHVLLVSGHAQQIRAPRVHPVRHRRSQRVHCPSVVSRIILWFLIIGPDIVFGGAAIGRRCLLGQVARPSVLHFVSVLLQLIAALLHFSLLAVIHRRNGGGSLVIAVWQGSSGVRK